MPRIDKGWVVIPVEVILSEKPRLDWSTSCNCILVDEPFTTTIESGSRRIQVALGSGSIICPPSCGETIPLEYSRLASPAWVRGVIVREECPANGDPVTLKMLSEYTGISFGERAPSKILEEGGIVAYPRLLDLEVYEGFCGRAEPLQPLHPLATPFSTGPEVCVEGVVEPVRGGRWWGGGPIASLRLERERRIIAYRYGVIWGDRPEALLLAAKPDRSSDTLLLAYALGALHACGSLG